MARMTKFVRLIGIAVSLTMPVQPQTANQQSAASAANADAEIASKLGQVKRVYVDSFGEDAVSKQAQANVIDALTKSHRFIVTETKEKADAIFKGVAIEKSSQEIHATSEGTAVRGAAIEDSEASTQTTREAHIAVRLVSNDGDVLWSTTQESKGAKYKGASTDAVEKVVKQLLWDLDKLEPKTKQEAPPK